MEKTIQQQVLILFIKMAIFNEKKTQDTNQDVKEHSKSSKFHLDLNIYVAVQDRNAISQQMDFKYWKRAANNFAANFADVLTGDYRIVSVYYTARYA